VGEGVADAATFSGWPDHAFWGAAIGVGARHNALGCNPIHRSDHIACGEASRG
jgi:hypothetical protein